MTSPNHIPFRSVLFLKNTESGFEDIKSYGADWHIVDIEDGVPHGKKNKVRKFISGKLQGGSFEGLRTLVRINGLEDREELLKDLKLLPHQSVDGFILPKLHGVEDMKIFERLIADAEVELGLKEEYFSLVPLLETPGAILNAFDIVNASSRNIAVFFGHADMVSNMHCNNAWESLSVARQVTVMAARSCGIEPFDTPYTVLDRPNGFIDECKKVKALGFAGKALIHPSQVPLANTIFIPTPGEAADAEELLEQYGRGEYILRKPNKGKLFIGTPHVRNAERIVKLSETAQPLEAKESVMGEMPRGGIKPEIFYEGSVVDGDFELSVTDAWLTLWESAFFTTNITYTSKDACHKLGLKDRLTPSMLLFTLSISMSVSKFSEYALFHLALKNAKYLAPVYPGDTLRNYFTINTIRPTSDGENLVTESTHTLINQWGDVVYTSDKTTLFPNIEPTDRNSPIQERLRHTQPETLRQRVITRADDIRDHLNTNVSTPDSPLIIHSHVKAFDESEIRSLSTLLRLTNSHHYNNIVFDRTDLLIPGPFVIAASLALPVNDLGCVLYEEIVHSSNINIVNFGDTIGAISYILAISSIADSPNLEEVTVKTIGIKNLDMNELTRTPLPKSLFTPDLINPSEYEAICRESFPLLQNRIACQTVRKLIRTK
jgi:citrate lyase beta subunit/acyl dehydratase